MKGKFTSAEKQAFKAFYYISIPGFITSEEIDGFNLMFYYEEMFSPLPRLGSYNYDLNTCAFGVGAGMYQIVSGTSDWSFFSSYFDDPTDSYYIRMGWDAYHSGR